MWLAFVRALSNFGSTFSFPFHTGSGFVQRRRSHWHIRIQSSAKRYATISGIILSITYASGFSLSRMCANQMEERPSTNCETNLQVACGHNCTSCVLYDNIDSICRHHHVHRISRIQFAFSQTKVSTSDVFECKDRVQRLGGLLNTYSGVIIV